MRLNRHGLPLIGEPTKKPRVKPQCSFNFAGNRTFGGGSAYITTPRKEAAHGQRQPVGAIAARAF